MRFLRMILCLVVYASFSAPSWGREDLVQELGHHWSNPRYTSELHLQIVWIVAVLAAAYLWAFLRRVLYDRRRIQ